MATARWPGYAVHLPQHVTDAVERVDVPTEVGRAFAWIMGDQSAESWCVQVHGRGATRRETIRAAPIYLARGMPVTAVSYRNDTEAPPSRDGKFRFGLDEWCDVDDAIGFAVARGARRIVLQGWSVGGQIALQVAAGRARQHARMARGHCSAAARVAARHTKPWNLDRARYEREVEDWLDARGITAVG